MSVEPTTARRRPEPSAQQPVARPTAGQEIKPSTIAAPARPDRREALRRLYTANTEPARLTGPRERSLLPPEAPLDMPEQDLS